MTGLFTTRSHHGPGPLAGLSVHTTYHPLELSLGGPSVSTLTMTAGPAALAPQLGGRAGAALTAALPRVLPTTRVEPAPSPVQAHDSVDWGKALALPAYAYAGASGALTGLTSFAAHFPPGGVIINPTGVTPNPTWTRYFVDGSVAHQAQPLLALASVGVCGVRAAFELSQAARTRDSHLQTAGLLDLSIAGMSAVQLVAPITGTIATLALTLVRGAVG
jgi:hypothetical protein